MPNPQQHEENPYKSDSQVRKRTKLASIVNTHNALENKKRMTQEDIWQIAEAIKEHNKAKLIHSICGFDLNDWGAGTLINKGKIYTDFISFALTYNNGNAKWALGTLMGFGANIPDITSSHQIPQMRKSTTSVIKSTATAAPTMSVHTTSPLDNYTSISLDLRAHSLALSGAIAKYLNVTEFRDNLVTELYKQLFLEKYLTLNSHLSIGIFFRDTYHPSYVGYLVMQSSIEKVEQSMKDCLSELKVLLKDDRNFTTPRPTRVTTQISNIDTSFIQGTPKARRKIVVDYIKRIKDSCNILENYSAEVLKLLNEYKIMSQANVEAYASLSQETRLILVETRLNTNSAMKTLMDKSFKLAQYISTPIEDIFKETAAPSNPALTWQRAIQAPITAQPSPYANVPQPVIYTVPGFYQGTAQTLPRYMFTQYPIFTAQAQLPPPPVNPMFAPRATQGFYYAPLPPKP